MRNLSEFLMELQSRVEPLEAASAESYWNATISGSKEDEDRAAELISQLRTIYSNGDDLAYLLSVPTPNDPVLARQLKIVTDGYRANQFSQTVIEDMSVREMEIEGLFSNFRADFLGKPATENELKQVLISSDNVDERLAAWKTSKQIGTTAEPKVLELISIRNAEARRLGYASYYSMQIELQELDENELFTILESVADELNPAFTSFKSELDAVLSQRFKTTPDELRPWHYSDPFFQSAPESPSDTLDSYYVGKNIEEITRFFFRQIGFEIDPLLSKSDLYEKPGKMQHAYCTSIGRGTHDVRVLCNVVQNSQWMGTLLHEFGHAVYDDLIDDQLPFFVRTVSHTMTTEAIAEMMGRFTDNGAWLKKYVGIPEDEASRVAAVAARNHRAHMLVFTQWVLVMANFERELYNNPDQDLDDLWWGFVEKYQQVRRPDFETKGVWASKIHLASSPAYYHNYLLGEMTASQMLSVIKTSVQGDLIESSDVGHWLTENVFRSGATYSWNDLLERATGSRLDQTHFVNELI